MAKGIVAAPFFLMFFSFSEADCQEEERIHIRNTLEINPTNCEVLCRLIVMLPDIQSNECKKVLSVI